MSTEKKEEKRIPRRGFLKGAAVGAAGMAAGALAGCSSPAATPAPVPTPQVIEKEVVKEVEVKSWLPAKWDLETDVVVVGHGFAAQAAAIEADKAGAAVLMLEKAPEELAGGNSRVCGQGVIFPPEWAWDDYFTYLKALTDGQGMPVDPDPATADEILKFYIQESAKNWDWFTELGATLQTASELGRPPGTWHPFYPNQPGADTVARQEQYFKVGGKYVDIGYGMNWYFLEDCIKERPGITAMYETPAKRLVQDPSTKEILGVIAESGGKEIYVKAKRAVCVCAGGWEYSLQMTRDFQAIPAVYSPGGPFNTGETIKMCWAAGADIRNMAIITAPSSLSVGVKPPYKSAIDVTQTPQAGATITVGANNRRWRDEYRPSTRGIENKEIAGLEGGFAGVFTTVENGVYVRDKFPMPIHIIFDEEARLSGPLFRASFAARLEGFTCSADNSAELKAGWITAANSIKELATKLGREPDPLFGRVPLEDTVAKWNESCAAGKDAEFDLGDPLHVPYGRPKELLKPIPLEDAPVYAIEAFPRCLNTQGGMRRNTESQVLDIEGNPIPRLYAAGENGDVWTVTYQCMSNVGGGCYGYGRVAGQNAAAEKPWE